MSTTTNSKMAGDKVFRTVTSITNINGVNDVVMTRFEEQFLSMGIADGAMKDICPVEAMGVEMTLVDRTKSMSALVFVDLGADFSVQSTVIEPSKVYGPRPVKITTDDQKRQAARCEDAITLYLGWSLYELENILNAATDEEMIAVEKLIEDAVEMVLLGEAHACRVFTPGA